MIHPPSLGSPAKPTASAAEDRMVKTMRLVLASSALLIIYLDPTEPERFVTLTNGALVLYWIYSAILYLLAARDSPLLRIIHPWSHWVDGGWYALLISLSSGTNSVFFFGFSALSRLTR